MSRPPTYPCQIAHRTRSVLPPEAQTHAALLGRALHASESTQLLAQQMRLLLAQLPPAATLHALDDLQLICGLYRSTPESRVHILAHLQRHPALGWSLLGHCDGYLREAAIHALNEAPSTSFEFCSLIYRLNDWVPQVRRAAEQVAATWFTDIPAAVVAHSAFFILGQAQTFGRWDHEASLLHRVIYRPDVLRDISRRLLEPIEGAVGQFLRCLLIRPGLDPQLPSLAQQAHSPVVRAIAMDALLHSRAQWSTGYRRQWVDKVYGISRRLPVLQTRPLTVQPDVHGLLAAAIRDPAAQVRRVAAEALLVWGPSTDPRLHAVATLLQHDVNRRVRNRATRYLRW